VSQLKVWDGSAWVPAVLGKQGPQGPQGSSGVITVNAPITNLGTSTSATLGLDTSIPRLTASQTFTGTQTLRSGSVTTPSAVVRAITSQTSNLQEWQDAAGVVQSRVAFDGSTILRGLQTGSLSFSGVTFNGISNPATVTTTPTLVVQGIASQTANLQDWRNSAGTILGGRNVVGQTFTGLTTPVSTAVGGATTAASGTGTVATITTTTATNAAVGDLITVAGVTPTAYNGTFVVTAVSNVTTFTVSYASTATGVQTVAGTVSLPAQASITARSAGTHPLIVRGAASQASELQKWQSSNGTDLARVLSNGTFAVPIMYCSNLYNAGLNTNSSLLLENAGARATTGVASNVALKVQNTVAIPTGDLFQALAGSTVVAKIDVAGKLTATSIFGGTP
jgi:hypothetical protein